MSAQRDRCVAQESGSATLLALRGQVKLCEATATGSSARAPRRPAWREHALRRGCYTSPPCIAAQYSDRANGTSARSGRCPLRAIMRCSAFGTLLRRFGRMGRDRGVRRWRGMRRRGRTGRRLSLRVRCGRLGCRLHVRGGRRLGGAGLRRFGRADRGRRLCHHRRLGNLSPGNLRLGDLLPPQAWPLRSPGAERRRPKCPVRATR